MSNKMVPIHPGQVLLEDYMVPRDLTANKLALDLHVPANRISEIVRGERGITSDTAIRLSIYFETSPELWMGLQGHYELQLAEDAAGDRIRSEVRHARL